jgi:hypothetical protein
MIKGQAFYVLAAGPAEPDTLREGGPTGTCGYRTNRRRGVLLPLGDLSLASNQLLVNLLEGIMISFERDLIQPTRIELTIDRYTQLTE